MICVEVQLIGKASATLPGRPTDTNPTASLPLATQRSSLQPAPHWRPLGEGALCLCCLPQAVTCTQDHTHRHTYAHLQLTHRPLTPCSHTIMSLHHILSHNHTHVQHMLTPMLTQNICSHACACTHTHTHSPIHTFSGTLLLSSHKLTHIHMAGAHTRTCTHTHSLSC